jgi:hypothetical protein
VTALLGAVVAWAIVRSHSTPPAREVATDRSVVRLPAAAPAVAVGDGSDGNAHASEREVAGMDRVAYDALARRTWELLKRGDAGELVKELARGNSIDSIRSDALRSRVSAKLKETDEDYAKKKRSASASEEAALQGKIAAGQYVPENPFKDEPATKAPGRDSSKTILMSAWRDLPDGTWIRIDLFEGEAPEFERSRREFRLIEQQRVNEITLIFVDHGLLPPGPSK